MTPLRHRLRIKALEISLQYVPGKDNETLSNMKHETFPPFL